jgi:hypothetical protein
MGTGIEEGPYGSGGLPSPGKRFTGRERPTRISHPFSKSLSPDHSTVRNRG